ncbi:hypothetical protein [Aurantimonas sp. VKM B-3413]|uniref:hypothetical protein n=1 Tax=Aurantimonas sp. VKM B-3413 TaxID=2779401 RepID=UPI001E6581AC|nr:hypothetical protein [Aurantimonas sp. VKM B-3413]MCB8838745.1 hypothetical protein [Aurantimonas sp. VKM B-3413]
MTSRLASIVLAIALAFSGLTMTAGTASAGSFSITVGDGHHYRHHRNYRHNRHYRHNRGWRNHVRRDRRHWRRGWHDRPHYRRYHRRDRHPTPFPLYRIR